MCNFKLVCFTVLVASALSDVSAQNTQTSCSACNCQLNNVQSLDQFVENKVARAVADATCKLVDMQSYSV